MIIPNTGKFVSIGPKGTIDEDSFPTGLLSTYTAPSVRYRLSFNRSKNKYIASIAQKMWGNDIEYFLYEECDTYEEAKKLLLYAIKNRSI